MAIRFLPGGVVVGEFSPEEAYQQDMALAEETAKARMSQPRFIAPGQNLDSPEALDRELFQPIRREYGIPEVNKTTDPRLFEIGNSVVAVNPHTGENTTVYTQPPKAVPEKSMKWNFGTDLLSAKPIEASLTPSAFASQYDSLPDEARTNAVNLAQLRGAGLTNNGFFQPIGLPSGSSQFRPSAVKSNPVKVNSKAERDALPAGQSYIAPDGKTYIKR